MHHLIFDRPARDFTESLTLGNGRLGACVYGELLREQIVLNESSVWSGSPDDADRPGASAYLPEIRRLLREGRNFEAQQLFAEHFTCQGPGTNEAHGTIVPFGCYQTLGRLLISHFRRYPPGAPPCPRPRITAVCLTCKRPPQRWTSPPGAWGSSGSTSSPGICNASASA